MKSIKGIAATTLLRVIATLPWSAVQGVGRGLGWLLWAIPTTAKQTVRINQSYCFPELTYQQRQILQKRTLSHIGKTMTESAAAWLWSVDKTLGLITEVEGEQVLRDALASGLGVVGITSHLGNWEVLNHYFCSQCKPIIFYRPPKLKALDQLISAQRRQLGNKVAPSTREGILSVIKEVRSGGAVGIPADPEPSVSAGYFVPFLGAQALTSKFVPSMLKGKKAIGVFLHAIRIENSSRFKVIIEAAPEAMYGDDAQLAVAAMSQVLEGYVRKWPEQYMWSMKRFKNRPAGEQRWY